MTTARRKIRDEADARACWAAAQAAGLDAGAWARGHGVDGRSLHTWRMNLGLGARTRRSRRALIKASPQRAQLVELVPTPNATRGRYMVRVGTAEIELDGRGIELAALILAAQPADVAPLNADAHGTPRKGSPR